MAQQLDTKLDRAFALADSDVSGASTELPTPSASKLIGWNSGGTALTNYASASIVATIVPTAFMETLLDDANAATARTTLGALAAAGDTMTGDLTMSGASVVEAEGAAVASAATTNIWATDGNTIHVTGTTTITSFGTAPQAGAWMKVIFDDALTLTHAANLNLPGAANITTVAGDVAFVYADTTTQFDVLFFKQSGAPTIPATQSVQETATSNVHAVTPGTQKYHPGMPKAWLRMTCAAGTPSVVSSYNVTSITDNGAGDFTVNFTVAFADANYACIPYTELAINSDEVPRGISVVSVAAGAFRFKTMSNAGAAEDNHEYTTLVFFGDQ